MPTKAKPEVEPAPVDVKASVPLEVKIIKESIEALGGSTEIPPGTANPTSVIIVPEQHPIPTTVENTVDTPLSVTADKPLPVVIQSSSATPPRPDVIKGEGDTLAPTTTEQDDIVTAGQRQINLLWEQTQSRIALMVVSAGVFLNSVLVVLIVFSNREVSITQLSLISISLQFINLTVGIIIGFYFSRTNHTKTGGTGRTPQDGAYTGR